MNESDWGVAEMKCPNCYREWVAVHPILSEWLECPGCGAMVMTPPAAEYIEEEEE